MSSSAKCNFCISYRMRLPGILLMCLPVPFLITPGLPQFLLVILRCDIFQFLFPALYISLFYYLFNRAIGIMVRVFTDGLGDRGSIPGRVIPKTQKMVLDAALLSTQHYKVRIKGKVEQSWEWSSTFPYTSV